MKNLSYIVSPRPENEYYYEVQKAIADVFVDTDDEDEGKRKAKLFFDEYLWDVESLEEVNHVRSPEHYPDRIDLLNIYTQAKARGLYCQFSGWEPGGDIDDSDLP